MDIVTVVLFVIGLVLLVAGAEVLVRGASSLAAAAGISPLVIGLTVVAYGTSAPEMAVSAKAAWAGQAELAVGNVVGSNICNVLLILGLSAAAAPLTVQRQLVRFDVPLMVLLSFLLYGLAADGAVGRLDGLLLAAGAIAYTAWSIVKSRKESRAMAAVGEPQPEVGEIAAPRPWWVNVLFLAAGLALLALGARWLVDGAVAFARLLGVSEVVIGLTIIAVGTSLPELATSVVASLRGERDIAVGNVVGSNIFNILAVLGVTGAVAPVAVPVPPTVLGFDLPVMIGVAVICLPIFFSGYRVARGEGLLFVALYGVYLFHLVLSSRKHEALHDLQRTMTYVLPLVFAVLCIFALHHWIVQRRQGRPAAGG